MHDGQAGAPARIERGLGEVFTVTTRYELAGLTAFTATRSS